MVCHHALSEPLHLSSESSSFLFFDDERRVDLRNPDFPPSFQFTDLLLAGTLTWELRKSSGGEIGFGGTNKMLDSLTTILIANGVGLATLQLTICGIYLSGTNYTLGVVGLFILHKIYTITALTSICRPLEMQRAANQNPVRAAEFSSGEEGTSTQDSTLFERIVGRVRKKGNDDLEKGSKVRRVPFGRFLFFSFVLRLEPNADLQSVTAFSSDLRLPRARPPPPLLSPPQLSENTTSSSPRLLLSSDLPTSLGRPRRTD